VPGTADEAGPAEAGYRPLLFSIADGMTGSACDAEDRVQDAFLGLTRARQARNPSRHSAPLPARRAEGEELARMFFRGRRGRRHGRAARHARPGRGWSTRTAAARRTQSAPAARAGRGVARLLAGLFRRGRSLGTSLRLASVNGRPDAVMYDAGGRVVSVIELDLADSAVQAIHAVVNPDKLGHIGPVSDVARLPEKELPQHRHNR
jgi:Sigma-70 region 2